MPPVAEKIELRIKTPRVFLPMMQPSRYKGLHGGRGSAKSHFFADHLIERCVMNNGTRAVCVREVQLTLKQSVKRLLEDKIKAYNLTDTFRVKESEIETPGGGNIIFQGMQAHTAESIKSLEGYDVAWVEEAQSLSQRSLDLLRPTIREENSELWFSWNPRFPTDPVDAFLRGKPAPPDAIVLGSTYRDNPFFPDVLRIEMEWDRSRDPDKYAHVWLGDYEKKSAARVFKNWRIGILDIPEGAVPLFGSDWGYSVDPAVLVKCYLIGERTLYVRAEAYKIGVEIDDLPEFFAKVPEAQDYTSIADSSRPETISYMKRHGFPKMEPSVKGKDSVKEGVIFLQGYDIVVHPDCIHTIDELTLYSYKVDKLTEQVLPDLADKKNHVIDSLRYAVEKVRRKKKAGFVTW